MVQAYWRTRVARTQSAVWGLVSGVLLACLTPSPAAADTPAPAPTAGPLIHFSSAAQAQQAIAAGEAEKERVERKYATEKAVCYQKFFTTACLDEAKDRRRQALNIVRDQEVAAHAFLRREKAQERDAALEQKRIEDERDAREREADVKAREAALERKRLSSEERQKEARERNARTVPDTRVTKHEQALQQRRAEEAREKPQREENVRSYERKLQEAQEKQREAATRNGAGNQAKPAAAP